MSAPLFFSNLKCIYMKPHEFLEELSDMLFEVNVAMSDALCAMKLLQERGASIGERRRCLKQVCELQQQQKVLNHIRVVALLFANKGEKLPTVNVSLNWIVRRWLNEEIAPESLQMVEELIKFVKERDNALWFECLTGHSNLGYPLDLF